MLDVPPGARLVVDLHFGSLAEGDAVLYRDGEGLLLGRIEQPPASAPEDLWEAWRAGALWIVKDRPEVPGNDSTLRGRTGQGQTYMVSPKRTEMLSNAVSMSIE